MNLIIYKTDEKLKKNILLLLILVTFSCTTIKVGLADEDYVGSVSETAAVKFSELSTPYRSFINGIPLNGDKIDTKGVFASPDKKNIFIFGVYPRPMILRTVDGGKTFNSFVFNMVISESSTDEESGNNKQRERKIKRDFNYCFGNDGVHIVFSYGEFIFFSEDGGSTWKGKEIFFDSRNSLIRKVIVTPDNNVIAFSDNRIGFSGNWDRKWHTQGYGIGGFPDYRVRFIDAAASFENGKIFVSLKDYSESSAKLSADSHAKWNGTGTDAGSGNSGVFVSDLKHKLVFTKTSTWVPVVFDGAGAAGAKCVNAYHKGLYQLDVDDNFKNTILYKAGTFKNGTNSAGYLGKMLKSYIDNSGTGVFSPITGTGFIGADGAFKAEEMGNTVFDGGVSGFANLNRENFDSRDYPDFRYDNSPARIFAKSTGYRIGDPVINFKSGSGNVYRISPDKTFSDIMINNYIQLRLKNDNTNFLLREPDSVFLRKIAAFENIRTFKIEKLNGKSWENLDIEPLYKFINSKGKRNSYYWYKLMDKKIIFKLELIFGTENITDMLYYPVSVAVDGSAAYITVSFFDDKKSYNETYKMILE